MKLFKSLKKYFAPNVTVELYKPKFVPPQKKKEKKPYPFYRHVSSYDYTEEYQCLACKEYLSVDDSVNSLNYCVHCGIKFKGQFTKKNQRYSSNRYKSYHFPIIEVKLRGYNRKNIYKSNLDRDSFSIRTNKPITKERLEFTKDKDEYYEWDFLTKATIYSGLSHASSKVVYKNMMSRVKYYLKGNKIIQLYVEDKQGNLKVLKEIRGEDIPYEPGYGKISCSGISLPLNFYIPPTSDFGESYAK